MIKPDVIVTWPRNCDYPLWRQFIRDNRHRFNEIIVVFMETNQGHNYIDFVMDAMRQDHVLFAQSPAVLGHQDWRDVAIKHALIQSYNADWVWFTEQDFLPIGDTMFEVLDAADASGNEWVAAFDGLRMHPCSLFIKRPLLSKIDKDFSAKPPEYDHFGAIQKQLQSITPGIAIDPETYTHMNGLSHNMTLASGGEKANYKHCKFRKYLEKCLEVTVPLNLIFVAMAKGYLEKYPCGE